MKKITDQLFFEPRFKDALSFAGLPSLLKVNYLLSDIYDQLMPQSLYYGKKAKLAPEDAALQLVCVLFDTYLEKDEESAPIDFAFNVILACKGPENKLPEKWQRAIQQYREERQKKNDELQDRMPSLVSARKSGSDKCDENSKILQSEELPKEAAEVWGALTLEFRTEYNIHTESGISLEQLMEWLIPFERFGLVVVVGTANDEPEYRLSPIEPSSVPVVEMKDKLEERLNGLT